MPKKRRLLWQLYPSYILITVISLFAVTGYASRSMKHFFLEQTSSDLAARANLFRSQIRGMLGPLDEQGIDRLCKISGKDSSTRITVILPSGRVVGDSEEVPSRMDNHITRPEFLSALKEGIGRSTRYSNTLERDLMYVGIPVKRDEKIAAVVRTSIPVDSIDTEIRRLEVKIAYGGLFMALVAAGLSLIVSRRISRPIEHIRKSAVCLAEGNFECSLPVTRTEEISGLSEAMKGMAVQLHERIETVKRQRNEIEAILSSMVEGVIAVDKEEMIISLNHAAGRMLECNPSDAKGLSIQEVVRNSMLNRFVKDTLISDEPVERDIVLSSDKERFIKGHGTLLKDAAGEMIGALVVLNDISKMKRLENVRRDFVANVSHEIKTPITAIKGFVETLRDAGMENREDAERFLEIIERHVQRLEAIIEDLLQLSRIEQERDEGNIDFVEAGVKGVIKTAIQLCESSAASKDITIEYRSEGDYVTRLDATLLEQAIANLIDNAVKYSDEKSTIRVSTTVEKGEVVIRVADDGRGIKKEHLSRLFERFYRVDKARSRLLGGTGLGLAIVKHIAQAHGGRIDVESIPGKGSTFTIYIPYTG